MLVFSIFRKIYHGKQGVPFPVELRVWGIADPVQCKCVLSPGKIVSRKRFEIEIFPFCKGDGGYVDTAAESVTGYVFN